MNANAQPRDAMPRSFGWAFIRSKCPDSKYAQGMKNSIWHAPLAPESGYLMDKSPKLFCNKSFVPLI